MTLPNPAVGGDKDAWGTKLNAKLTDHETRLGEVETLDPGSALDVAVAAKIPSFVVNRSFGDNSTDATAHIQSIIDLATALGGKITLPEGVFQVGALTVPHDGTYIEGAGAGYLLGSDSGATILRAKPGFTGDILTFTGSYCGLRGVTIDGNNTAANGLHLYGNARSYYSDLYIRDCAKGIMVEQNASAVTAHANKYSNISILGCSAYGAHFSTGSFDSEINNLWIGSCAVGMRVESGENSFVTLHVWGSTANGVEIRGSNNRITNAYIESNGANGLDILNSSDNAIVGCELYANITDGAQINGTSVRNRFIGTVGRANGQSGFRLVAGDYNIFNGCTAVGNASNNQLYGIRLLSGTKNIVSGCVARTATHTTAGFVNTATGTIVIGSVLNAGDTVERFLWDASKLRNRSGSAAVTFVGSGDNGRAEVWAMDSAVSEAIGASEIVPTSWSKIRVVAYWTNAGAGTGDVRWQIVTTRAAVGADITANSINGAATTATAGVTGIVISTDLGTIDVAPGELLKVHLRRLGADAADTLGNDAGVLMLALERVA